MWFFKKDNNSVTLVTDADDTSLTVSAVRKLDEKDSVEDTAKDIPPKTTTEKKGDGKRKGKTEDAESKTKTEMKDDRKRRRKMEVTEWSVGDKCEGYFVPHKVWYEAKLLKKIDEDIYKVKYECDRYTEDLPLELLRPV